MATRGRRSRMCTRRDSANSLLEEMQTQGLRAIGDTIFDMAAGDTIVDMSFVRCMQARRALNVVDDVHRFRMKEQARRVGER